MSDYAFLSFVYRSGCLHVSILLPYANIKLLKTMKTKYMIGSNSSYVRFYSLTMETGSSFSIHESFPTIDVPLYIDNRKRRRDREQSIEEERKIKKRKPSKKHLRSHKFEDVVAENPIEWSAEGYDVSEALLQYKERCKTDALNNYLDSDIETLALNGIFFISEKNDRYNIPNKIREFMMKELNEKYRVDINFQELDQFQVNFLRPIYKKSEKNIKKALKKANNIRFDHAGYEVKMNLAIYNMLTELCHPLPDKTLEDEFTRRFVQPILGPFFEENKNNVVFGNRDESRGSEARREGEGLKSDYGMKVVYKDFEHHLLQDEVKGPNQLKDNNHHHPDFVKLCNLLKDEINFLLMEDCPDEVPVFGVLVGGYNVTIYVMDLVYTHIYRVFEIDSFHIPCSLIDLPRLDRGFDSLVVLMELYKKSSKMCLEFMKKKCTPGTPPRRRSLSIKSF